MQHINSITVALLFILLLSSCGNKTIKTPAGAIPKLEAFIRQEKFVHEDKTGYTGTGSPVLKASLTEKINLTASDFQKLAATGTATERQYQQVIRKGLNRFSDIYINLDSEDRERICSYFEELMDMVGLKSSNGQLNNFRYGFDPAKE